MSTKNDKQNWRYLFDGESFNGWEFKSAEHGWEIHSGAIHLAQPRGGAGRRDMYTVEKFADFVLELEYKIAPKTNSGVFFRVADINDPKDWRFTGFELQILDPALHEGLGGKEVCGAIYGLVAPTADTSRAAGEWNQVRIECRGPLLAITLNGVLVTHLDVNTCTEPFKAPDNTPTKFPFAYATQPRRGHIALQDHGGEIWFRNIRLLEL
ncbi:MAG TPA: DUF1080 domain-containing protein [Firmicutes bacterium]|nr:DUF1080 domain-containing protein [Bacillota bacterium]